LPGIDLSRHRGVTPVDVRRRHDRLWEA